MSSAFGEASAERSKWVTNTRVSYRLHPRLHVAVTAANLFDRYPDEWWDFAQGLEAQGPSLQGILPYPGAVSPFGMNGRTINVQLAWR